MGHDRGGGKEESSYETGRKKHAMEKSGCKSCGREEETQSGAKRMVLLYGARIATNEER